MATKAQPAARTDPDLEKLISLADQYAAAEKARDAAEYKLHEPERLRQEYLNNDGAMGRLSTQIEALSRTMIPKMTAQEFREICESRGAILGWQGSFGRDPEPMKVADLPRHLALAR